MSVSASMISWKISTQITPIILTGGIATAQGGAIPIVNLTNPPLAIGSTLSTTSTSVKGQIVGGTNPQLDGTGADYMPVAGGTLIHNETATYPFANQAVAANAIIAQPLNISMSMIIPVTGNLPYPARQSLMMALVSSLNLHIRKGGLFSVITPAYIYTNCILLMLRDVSGGEVNQAQYRWQWDFFQPLVTQAQANQAQNGLMQTITNGTPIVGTPSYSTGLPVTNPPGTLGLTPAPEGFS
jgi:hypothetical protein